MSTANPRLATASPVPMPPVTVASADTVRSRPAAVAGAAAPAQSDTAVAADPRPPAARRWLSLTRVSMVVTALLLYAGYELPTERYIAPDRGFGYALGIIGGGAMLVLLLYPARKRLPWLGFIGTVRRWFQAHMVLGIVAPVCVLYHANFALGAPNSNVALFCTLIVAGSGLFGRYFFSKIHHGLYGHRATLAELGASTSRLRAAPLTIAFLPELIQQLELEEQHVMSLRATISSAFVVPFVAQWRIRGARRRLRRYARHALTMAARDSLVLLEQRRRLRRTAFAYIDTRLQASGKVVTFQAYERLFSYWHLMHLPLFYMLVVAAIAHVIAVHVY